MSPFRINDLFTRIPLRFDWPRFDSTKMRPQATFILAYVSGGAPRLLSKRPDE